MSAPVPVNVGVYTVVLEALSLPDSQPKPACPLSVFPEADVPVRNFVPVVEPRSNEAETCLEALLFWTTVMLSPPIT